MPDEIMGSVVANPTEMTTQQLEQAIQTATTQQTQVVEPPVAPERPSLPIPPVEPQVVEPQVTQPIPEPTQQVVEKPAELTEAQSKLQEVLDKKHLQSPEELASIYLNLEKELSRKSQQVSQLQKQIPTQPAQPQAPQVFQDSEGNYVTPQQQAQMQFKQMYEADPIGTIVELNRILLQPVMQSYQQIELKNEISTIASSKETADFNLPEVQKEIQDIIQSNPQKYVANLKDNIKDLYYMAKGRMASRLQPIQSPSVQAQQSIVQPNVMVEGRNRAIPTQQVDVNSMSASELEKLIISRT